MKKIPSTISDYISNIQHPVALVGCRTQPDVSLDCCEYDLAILTNGNNKILKISDHTLELIYFGQEPDTVDRGSMIFLDDNILLPPVTIQKYRKALAVFGKKSLVSSLFYQRRINDSKEPILSGMWLKFAAFDFLHGILALSGSRSMPLHELGQIRQLRSTSSSIAEGIENALECVAIERATRPLIYRASAALRELKSTDYDTELIMSKARHLLDKRMLPDCYYYIVRMAARIIANKPRTFYKNHKKLIQVALDLASDAQHTQKLQKNLFKAANGILKNLALLDY